MRLRAGTTLLLEHVRSTRAAISDTTRSLTLFLLLRSASTWTSTTSDYIEYTLQPNSLVASVEIVPYRVYWYPGSPTYGPQRVSFQLFELLRTEDGVPPDSANLSAPVYESPVYDVLNDMKVMDDGMARLLGLSWTDWGLLL